MKPKYPKFITDILKECDLAYGIILLLDYKSKKFTSSQIKQQWLNFKNKKYETLPIPNESKQV